MVTLTINQDSVQMSSLWMNKGRNGRNAEIIIKIESSPLLSKSQI